MNPLPTPHASTPSACHPAPKVASGLAAHAPQEPHAHDARHASPAHHPPHGCRACTHHGPLQRHATRHSWWRDVPQDGRPQYRRGHIVRWRCPACGHTHAYQPEWALPGKRMTLALDAWLRHALTQGLSARAMALRCGLDAKTVRNWLRERACGACSACDMD